MGLIQVDKLEISDGHWEIHRCKSLGREAGDKDDGMFPV